MMASADILKTIAASLGGSVIGALATIGTGAFGYLNVDRSHDIEMVRISLSILGGENKETSLQGRMFALRALKEFTGVHIPDTELKDWAKTGTIPEDVAQPRRGYFRSSSIAECLARALALEKADLLPEGTEQRHCVDQFNKDSQPKRGVFQ